MNNLCEMFSVHLTQLVITYMYFYYMKIKSMVCQESKSNNVLQNSGCVMLS